MKTIGIIGGMGPLATADLFNKIVSLTEAGGDNDHIHIIIDNNTEIPDRTDYIMNDGANPEKHLIKSALKLEIMGADVLIMPCNTAHFFYNRIIQYINIPFINMIEETAKEIVKSYKEKYKVGLLATEGVYNAGVYDKIFRKYSIDMVKPSAEQQKQITNIIYSIKAGKKYIDTTSFKKVMSQMKSQGAETFILGCTELPIAFQLFGIDEKCIDPTKILACSAIDFVGGICKDPCSKSPFPRKL